MNNKGFTLIELLAVIVILAIIALIATPIILNIINDARKGAKQRSAEYVYEAVQLAYQTQVALKTGELPTLAEVEAQITSNGLSNATLSGDVITTKDHIACTLSNDSNKIAIACVDNDGDALNGWTAPDTGDMKLATATSTTTPDPQNP